MRGILEHIAHHAAVRPAHPALIDGKRSLCYRELQQEMQRTAAALHLRRVGLLAANGCAWAVIDLAMQRAGTVSVPMPTFFSDAQLRHLIDDADLDLIVTDQAARVAALLPPTALATALTVAGTRLDCFVLRGKGRRPLPPGTVKITYTSGTTGTPKGVCLRADTIERVALSLSDAVAANGEDRALSLLPLSTLLANIGGLYAPLYNGATAILPDLADCGLRGAAGVSAALLTDALHRHHPTATILVPQLLKMLVESVEQGQPVPAGLRFVAVGGAPVAPALLSRARALGLPVYQGYGLSEAGSVVTLNLPGGEHAGSVGRTLPHAAVHIAADGEIMVSGNLFAGYLGQPPREGNHWPTGDLGRLDGDGYLYITGRKKTAFATAYGRKLNPEWVESELTASPHIAQAVLFGEARSFNVALIVPRTAEATAQIDAAVAAINETVPDYARVSRWIAVPPFTARNGLANAGGTPDRRAIGARYAEAIDVLYRPEPRYAVL